MYTQERFIVYDVVVELHICYIAKWLQTWACPSSEGTCLCMHSYHLRLEWASRE